MDTRYIALLAVYLAILLAISPFLGRYIRECMENGRYRLTAWGRPIERAIYRIAGVDLQA